MMRFTLASTTCMALLLFSPSLHGQGDEKYLLVHASSNNNKNADARSSGAPKQRQTRAENEIIKDKDDDDIDDDDTTVFKNFVAHNKTMTCSADEHARPFNNQIRGVNLGGWFVLEPWITPSLFYQFLGGKDDNSTAFDMYSFCDVLGPIEGNRQLHNHWNRWVTEGMIRLLAESGAVNSLRLPVGDFMFKPYGPYIGCADGALDYVDKVLEWAYSYGLTVLFDIHTMRDSQNGFDNSGRTLGFEWTTALSFEYASQTTFQHWPIRDARWIGTFDHKTATYSSINHDNIQHGLDVIQAIVDQYAYHPAVLGLEPVNEPWQYTPIPELKRFYWEGYLIVKRGAPYWKYIMHDSFRLDTNIWGGFMAGCPERALDTHIYQAWRDPDSRIGFYQDACQQKHAIVAMEQAFGPVIVGEWSLATDNCAMWLNGFNDNLPGFPRIPCKYAPCHAQKAYSKEDIDAGHITQEGKSYLADSGQPGLPVDPSKPLQGPYGTGLSGPIFGLCPATRDWVKESTGNPLTGRDWVRAPPNAPRSLDDTDDVMTRLARKKILAFSGSGHGFYFWNFRTDRYDPQWSYLAALDRGWIPSGGGNEIQGLTTACMREDVGAYKCVVKHGQLDESIRKALLYVLEQNAKTSGNGTIPDDKSAVLNQSGAALSSKADDILGDYFDQHHLEGVTCDFGGIAMLIELNTTLNRDEDDRGFSFSDDEYFGVKVVHERDLPPIWVMVSAGCIVAAVGALVGFITAMHCSPRFNEKMRKTSFLKPIARSQNNLLRSSLALPLLLDDGDEIEHLVKLRDD